MKTLVNTRPETPTALGAEGLATVKAAAAFLCLSRSTIYNLMDSGRLPYARIGRARRLPWAGVRRFAEQAIVGDQR